MNPSSAGDLDRLAGVGALIEQVEAHYPLRRPESIDESLPGSLDVEDRGQWWRIVDERCPINRSEVMHA